MSDEVMLLDEQRCRLGSAGYERLQHVITRHVFVCKERGGLQLGFVIQFERYCTFVLLYAGVVRRSRCRWTADAGIILNSIASMAGHNTLTSVIETLQTYAYSHGPDINSAFPVS